MRVAFFCSAACALLALPGCGDRSESMPHTPPVVSEAAAGAGVPAGAVVSPEHEATLKDFIRRSGGSCASIVSVRSLGELTNRAVVVCTEHAGGSNPVSYTVDLDTEQVQPGG